MEQRKTLERSIRFRDYVGLGLGCIIGVGWVIVAGDWLNRGGPLGAILAFIIGGLLLIAVGKCYAELTAAIPVAGGELAFSYKAFGSTIAFMTAWLLALDYISVCPFETVAMGWLFEYIVPGAETSPLYSVGAFDITLTSILPGFIIGLLVIAMNYKGVKITARFQTILVYAMFVCVAVFVVVAFLKGSFANMLPLFSEKGTFHSVPASILAVLPIVPWFMVGFDTIPQAAEESGKKMDPKDLGKAVILSIIAGFMFYVIIIMAFSVAMPWKEATQFELPTAEVFHAAFGYDWAAKLVLIAAFLGLISTLNGIFLASTRLLFSAGRGGLLPRWFGEIHEKHHTPKNAIIFIGVITLIGPFVGKASLIPIVNVGSVGFMTAAMISCLSSIRLRKKMPDMKRPYKVRHRATLTIGALVSLIFVLLLIIPGSPSQIKWPLEYIIIGGWAVLGYIGYRTRRKKEDITKAERDYQILGEYK